jgi:pSer/pThr/pTyr-binding forkhead associated (FHA) protein
MPADEAEPTEGEVTRVRAKPIEPLYSVEVWRDGVRQSVVPIVKPEITIGRGSKSVAVDLPIKGDPEVSRVHAVLARDPEGKYWLTSKGRNATLVGGHEISREESTEIKPDDKIEICSFTLRIQPQ